MKQITKLCGFAVVLLLLAAAVVLLQPRNNSSSDPRSEAEIANRPRRNSVEQIAPKDFPLLARRMAKGDHPRLSLQEIEDYVNSRNRSSPSLLSAFRLSGEKAYLDEALEKFPKDPQVLLMSLQVVDDPAERLKILESLKQADPENAIANYLAARAHFDLGKDDEAFRELLESEGKRFNDFTKNYAQDDEEAYLSAGFPSLEAKMKSFPTKFATMHVGSIRENLTALRENHESNGDLSAADSVRGLQYEMGRQIQQSGMMIDLIMGIAFEKQSLKGIDTADAIARLEEIDQWRESLVEIGKQSSALLETSTVPESDWLHYFDRAKLFGEKAAMDWLLEKHPEP